MLLAEAWAALGLGTGGQAAPIPGTLQVDGPMGHLPSALPVEDTAIACVGAALLAAACLQEQRSGDTPAPVRLATGHVAAALRSEAYLRRGGEAFGPGFAPLSRFWRAANGWVRTHANYRWHHDRLLRALGVADDAEAVRAAIKNIRRARSNSGFSPRAASPPPSAAKRDGARSRRARPWRSCG